MKPEWKAHWPALSPATARFTSPETPDYNCIAFGVGRTDEWWEPYIFPPEQPGIFWPTEANPDNTPDAWAGALATEGFVVCADERLEPAFVKVVIYADAQGTATHVARQLKDGRWTSKLGIFEDIEHDTLAALEGPLYGRVALVLRRPRRDEDP